MDSHCPCPQPVLQAGNEQGSRYALLATSRCSLPPLRIEAEGRELGRMTGRFSPMSPRQRNHDIGFRGLSELYKQKRAVCLCSLSTALPKGQRPELMTLRRPFCDSLRHSNSSIGVGGPWRPAGGSLSMVFTALSF